ncbi:MAG: hypothetical protein NZM38_10205 [Cytophagales bacterium]|nr:hypothetical protein [Cytophagales bacterium]MDW8385126.1 hypothetical protein [Flammeovirgaceae bacterium]
MKYWICLAISLFSSIIIIKAQPIVFKVDSIYVGRLKINDFPLTRIFEYQILDDSTEIVEVQPDCACSALLENQYEKKRGSLQVTFDAYKAGSFLKKIKIIYKVKENTDSTFVVLAGYIEPFDTEPFMQFPFSIGKLRTQSKNINLGIITNQGVVRKNILIYNDAPYDIIIDSIYTPPYLEIVWKESPRIFKAKQINEITLFYHPEIKNDFGYSVDDFVLFTKDTSFLEYHFTITATIRQYTPPLDQIDIYNIPQLYIKELEVSYDAEHNPIVELFIKNIGNQSLIIYEIEHDEILELISLDKSVLMPQEEAMAVFKIKPIKKNHMNELQIVVFSNAPLEPLRKVNVPFKAK